MKFERAAQVNARFAASAFPRSDIVAALHELGLEDQQFTILDRPLVAEYVAPVAPGLATRLRTLFGGKATSTAATTPVQDVQIMVHLGQDDHLAAQVQELFRRSGAAGVEYFGPTSTP
jgi:hypothetical protein